MSVQCLRFGSLRMTQFPPKLNITAECNSPLHTSLFASADHQLMLVGFRFDQSVVGNAMTNFPAIRFDRQ